MTRRLLIIAAVLATFLLAGCGGNGIGPGVVGQGSLPFSYPGTWTGTFKDAGLHQNGTLSLGIAVDGRTVGVVQNTTTAQSGSVNGSVVTAGMATLTLAYPTAQYSLAGPITISGGVHLTGTLTEQLNGAVVGPVAIDLLRQ